jgi:hypothetical protein
MPLCTGSEQCPGRVEFIQRMTSYLIFEQESQQQIQNCPETYMNFTLRKLDIFRKFWNSCTCCICPHHQNCKTCFNETLTLHMCHLLRRAMQYDWSPIKMSQLQQEHQRLYQHCVHYRMINGTHF